MRLHYAYFILHVYILHTVLATLYPELEETIEADCTLCNTNQEHESCSLCLEHLHDYEEHSKNAEKTHSFPCSHRFHRTCILLWADSVLPDSLKCPLCRRDVSGEFLFERLENLYEMIHLLQHGVRISRRKTEVDQLLLWEVVLEMYVAIVQSNDAVKWDDLKDKLQHADNSLLSQRILTELESAISAFKQLSVEHFNFRDGKTHGRVPSLRQYLDLVLSDELSAEEASRNLKMAQENVIEVIRLAFNRVFLASLLARDLLDPEQFYMLPHRPLRIHMIETLVGVQKQRTSCTMTQDVYWYQYAHLLSTMDPCLAEGYQSLKFKNDMLKYQLHYKYILLLRDRELANDKYKEFGHIQLNWVSQKLQDGERLYEAAKQNWNRCERARLTTTKQKGFLSHFLRRFFK